MRSSSRPAAPASGEPSPPTEDREELQARCQELATENELLRRADQVQRELVQMVLEGRGIASIADRLCSLSGNPVAVDDHLYHVIACSPTDVPTDRHWQMAVARGAVSREFLGDTAAGAYVRRAAAEKRPVLMPTFPEDGFDQRRLMTAILAGGDILGYVTILEAWQPFQDFHEPILKQAALILALELMKQRVALETELRLMSDFLQDLFSGNFASRDAIASRAGFLGIDLMRPWTLLLLDVDDVDALCQACQVDDPAVARLKLFEIVRRVVGGSAPGSLAVMHSECVVILTPTSDGIVYPRTLAETLKQEVQWAFPSVTASVAIGGQCVELADFGQRHAEARRALDAVASLGKRDQTVTLDDLGIYGILFRREDHEELLSFANRVLGPLIAYDRAHRSNLLETLRLYLEENGAFRATSRRLSVHLNTLRGRLERIEQICQVDLGDAHTRLNFQIALEVHGLGKSSGGILPAGAVGRVDAQARRAVGSG